MIAKIQIRIDPAKTGHLAMIELAGLLIRLAAHIMRTGVVMPVKIADDDGAIVAEMTIQRP
jgi:hypothetical protein